VTTDAVVKTGLGLKSSLKTIFEVLVLTKAVLVLTLDGLKDLKNCDLKTKNVLRPFLDLKDLKVLNLDETKFQFLRS